MMKIAAATDIGSKRDENQDDYRAGSMTDGSAWAVVCDGMGGAKAGSVASGIAVRILEEDLRDKLELASTDEEIRDLLTSASHRANEQVYRDSVSDPEKHGMGTTMVAAVLKSGKIHILHAGDSRAYLYFKGSLDRLTKDHSIVEEMVENGMLTPTQAQSHPDRNLITRAVGVNERFEPEYGERNYEPGAILLLCSDGLTNSADEKVLCRILDSQDLDTAADTMIKAALSGGGQDNITVVLVGTDAGE